jgi:hypothetical protein
MNISDYSTKVKNLVDALASIGTPVDDEDLVAVTLNGLGKDYSQFCTSIAVRKTFPDFQDLIILLISEEMKIVEFKIMSTIIDYKPNIGILSKFASKRKTNLIVIRKGDDGATNPKNHGGMDFTMCVCD